MKRIPKPEFDRSYLLSRLSYDATTGQLTWKKRETGARMEAAWNAKFAGTSAGREDSTGYLQIAIDGRRYPATHLIWMIMKNEWPSDIIDHRNRNRTDNRFANLRHASMSQNSQNAGVRRNGLKGAFRITRSSSWQSVIIANGRRHYLGSFPTEEAAARRYDEAARELHGEFAVVNFK